MQVLKTYFALTLLLLLSPPWCSAQMPSRDYQVRAACLYNFSSFVEWPESSFANAKSPLIIGIVGKNPFGDYLEQLTSGEFVGTHPIVVRYFDSASDIGACHILYINSTDKREKKSIIQKMAGRKVLTVSDAAGFADMGGMVRLYQSDDKIKIQININATKNERLIVSTKLLRLAEIIKR